MSKDAMITSPGGVLSSPHASHEAIISRIRQRGYAFTSQVSGDSATCRATSSAGDHVVLGVSRNLDTLLREVERVLDAVPAAR